MTFDASLTEVNYNIVKTELDNLYGYIQKREKSMADKIEAILAEL
jgi:hypothetical protein